MSFKWSRMRDNKYYLPSLICFFNEIDIRLLLLFCFLNLFFHTIFVLSIRMFIFSIEYISNWYKLEHIYIFDQLHLLRWILVHPLSTNSWVDEPIHLLIGKVSFPINTTNLNIAPTSSASALFNTFQFVLSHRTVY